MKKLIFVPFIFMLVFVSCHNKPSEAAVQSCLLKQYDCSDHAKIISFKVENSAPIPEYMGTKGYEFIVSGQIEWTADCQSLFQVIPAGHIEAFQDKHVVLVKMDNGWTCP